MAFPWMGRITSWSAALRAKASRDPKHPYQGIVADLPLGTRVTVTGQQGGWLHVAATINDRTRKGYVSQELVAPASSGPSGKYYQLVPYGNILAVVKVDGKKAARGDGDILTEEKLQSQLQQHSVPIVTVSALSGFINSDVLPPTFDRHVLSQFSLTPGTLSGALAAGVVGAIWGTEVPLLGNIVGFVIGFAGYYAVDALMGDEVEQGVRISLE
jgi:hypothetical protein